MKKKFTLALSMLLMAGMAYDYNHNAAHTFSNGAPAGHTGSPADGVSCAKSGCHAGGPNQTNETIQIGADIPESGYVGGTTYNISVTMTKSGGQKFGFQLSPQDNSGDAVGSLIAGSGTSITGGHYMTHLAGTTTASGGTKTWNFQWTAPTAGTGNVNVYYAGNFTNNMNNSSGDVIVTGSVVANESNVGISEAELASISVYPNPVIDEIHVAAIDVDEEIMITLYSMDGKKVLEETHEGGEVIVDVASKSLNTGVYFLHIEVEGKSTVKKLLIK